MYIYYYVVQLHLSFEPNKDMRGLAGAAGHSLQIDR